MPVCLQCLFFLRGNNMNLRLAKNKLYKHDNSQIHLFTLATGALVSGHQHKWCCVQTLGISDTQVPSLGVMIRHWVFEVPKYHLVLEYKVAEGERESDRPRTSEKQATVYRHQVCEHA